jgi:hypothetical protein
MFRQRAGAMPMRSSRRKASRNEVVQSRKAKRRPAKRTRPGPIVRARRRPGISDARLERGLGVLSETKDINAAARSIRVSVERFKRAAKRRNAIRRQERNWIVVRRLQRKMPIFTGGKQLAVRVRSKSASLIGRYMSAVGQFLKTNDAKFLAEFKDLSVKDVNGKAYQFETDPNVLYRLLSAGGEPFEEMYRIVI